MRYKFIVSIVFVGVLLVTSSKVFATMINLTANMDCAQQGTCLAGGTGTGTGTMVFDDVTNALSFNIAWSGLSGSFLAVFFHGPAAPGTPAGIVGPGLAPSNPSAGSFVLSPAEEADLLAALWYISVHTSSFNGGEIRGQINVVPEPGTFLLLGSALAGLGFFGRRKIAA